MKLLFISFLIPVILYFMPLKNQPVYLHSDIQGQKPIFTFGILADVQYCDYEPYGTRFYRSSLNKLREAISTFKKDSPDFIINLGDIIDRDYGSYKPVIEIIDSSGFNTYHVAGNHDFSVDPRLKKGLPVLSSSKGGYYSFIHDNFRFIFLNGNEISTYASKNKTVTKQAADYLATLKNRGEINAVEWNGGLGKSQMIWFKNQLDEAAANNENVFLFCHFPVVPENVHNLLNYKEVIPVLNNYPNIIAWFNGHNHAGNYGNINNIHFVTFKGMVETDTSNSYALVDVYKDRVGIRGFGREKSQILEY